MWTVYCMQESLIIAEVKFTHAQYSYQIAMDYVYIYHSTSDQIIFKGNKIIIIFGENAPDRPGIIYVNIIAIGKKIPYCLSC